MGHSGWISLGKVFGPDQGPDWMRSHAQVPTPLLDEDAGIIRVYFASRPQPGLTLTSFVDLDIRDPRKIIYVNEKPILELGRPGTFDEHGIMPSCAVRHGKEVYLYYSGWSQSVGVPYTNSTGLAISRDGGASFAKISEGPILAKSRVDPFSATSPFVMKANNEWLMWYCSGTGWIPYQGKQEHIYDIKFARSDDGINWKVEGIVALPATEAEQALTRPWVRQVSGVWEMFYCHRKACDFRDGEGAYNLNVALSNNLDTWKRQPIGQEEFPRHAWDQKTQAYPALIGANGTTYLFYNGDGFGVDGFGILMAKP